MHAQAHTDPILMKQPRQTAYQLIAQHASDVFPLSTNKPCVSSIYQLTHSLAIFYLYRRRDDFWLQPKSFAFFPSTPIKISGNIFFLNLCELKAQAAEIPHV